jgi:hypothetical protein
LVEQLAPWKVPGVMNAIKTVLGAVATVDTAVVKKNLGQL